MATNTICTWDFTLPQGDLAAEQLKGFLKIHCKKWCFQLERGGQTGYMHYQGRVSLKVKARKGPEFPGIHWSVTSNANRDNEFYVLKEDTRVEGPWSDRDKYIPLQVQNIQLYPWQQDILDDANIWDTRTINMIICKEGNIGKSTLATYAGCRGIARAIPMMDSYKDYMRMVMDTPKVRLYLIDFPRCMNKSNCGSFWSAIETIKNGYAYDDRYGFREEYFDCPNIWVFSNTVPDLSQLSKDRWRFFEVTEVQALRCINIVPPGAAGADRPDGPVHNYNGFGRRSDIE